MICLGIKNKWFANAEGSLPVFPTGHCDTNNSLKSVFDNTG